MRVLLVSDIHSNLAALDAVLKDAGAFDQIWCLGDIVGYGPEPNACIERLRSFDLLCLCGNHDLAAIDRLAIQEFSQDAQTAIWWTRERLTAAHVRWLETLSAQFVVTEHGITLVHASPRDPIWEYMVTPQIAERCLDAIRTPVGFNGHTHRSVIFRKPALGLGVVTEYPTVNLPISLALDRMFVNPGSVGQPRDDDPRAAYALLDLDANTVTFRRVQYDIAHTQNLMRQVRLPTRLITRLRHGE